MTVRTTVVTGQIINPLTNRVVANKKLSVRLYPDVVYSLDGTQQIIRSSWITTDATGTFADTFQVNADLDPAGSYYTVQVAPGLIDSLIVPYSVSPVTYRSCLVANPTNPNPIIAGVSQAELDASVSTAVDGLLGTAAPAALDTLTELAAALGDDANFATTITNSLAAKVPTSRTVAGHPLSGDVTLVKGDVGLGSVDNTADTAKPVSTAQQTALNLKADTSVAAVEVVHATVAGTARPSTALPVTWVGTVAPSNWVEGDLWLDPSDTPGSTYTLGAAGGDLAGAFPNPTIGAGKVTAAKLAADAIALFDAAGAAASKSAALSVVTATATVSSTAAETALFTYTVPGGLLAVGSELRLRLYGSNDNIATSGILTFRVRWGGLSGPVFGSTALSSQASAAANKLWTIDFTIDARAIGASGFLMAGGVAWVDFGATSANNRIGASPTGSTQDTTVAKDLVLTAQFATADPGNICRILGGSLVKVA